MTLARLKARILAYLDRTLADLTVDGVDLVLDSINQAKADAQRQRDFELAKVYRLETIPVLGVTLTSLGLKKILAARVAGPSGSLVPFFSADNWNELYLNSTAFVQCGDVLRLLPEPTSTVDLGLYAVQYLPDYTAVSADQTAEDIDWFIQHGAEWLAWEAVVRLNYVTERFLFRQEGALAPPEKQRDAAWQRLVTFDALLTNTAATDFNLD